MGACIFCEIIAGRSPARFMWRTEDVVAFHPIGPQVPGHLLFVPTRHVADATESPVLTGRVMAVAASFAKGLAEPVNIITSVGAEATQSVFHLHVHLLPRGKGDGLRPSWPWVRPRGA